MFSIYAILLTCVIFAVLYAPRFLCWFSALFPQKKYFNDEKNRFAIFIPARDEGKAIIPLLESINRQTYDKDFFDTFIVVKNPNDEAYEYAKICGAEVYCDVNQKCKADCTDYTFKEILKNYPKKYDGIFMVDADTVLDENCILEMNNAIASGAEIINCKKRVKNYLMKDSKMNNMVTMCNGLIWNLLDDLGSRFKSDHGLSTMPISNGLYISMSLIEKWNGWNLNKTFTEDMELYHESVVHQYKTAYASHSIVYTEEAPSLKVTNMRKSRWMGGIIQCNYMYFADVMKAPGLRGFMDKYFFLSLWFVYIFVACMIGMAGINVVSTAFNYIVTKTIETKYLWAACASVGILYGLFFVMTLFIILICHKDLLTSKKNLIKILFVNPLYYFTYIPVIARGIISKNEKTWTQVQRVNIEQVELETI